MPDCSEIVAVLSEYLDRDLPPETCSAIAAHLSSCAQCETAAEGLRRTVEMCRQFRSERVPGPLPADKHQEMKAALEKVLAGMRARE